MHQSFATITRGLDRHLPPMRLSEKAKWLEKAKGASLDEINRVARDTEEA
jgi:hypothetical protein